MGPTVGKRRPERLQVGYECGQASLSLTLSNPADIAWRAIANQKPWVGINPIKDDAMRDCFAPGGSSGWHYRGQVIPLSECRSIWLALHPAAPGQQDFRGHH